MVKKMASVKPQNQYGNLLRPLDGIISLNGTDDEMKWKYYFNNAWIVKVVSN